MVKDRLRFFSDTPLDTSTNLLRVKLLKKVIIVIKIGRLSTTLMTSRAEK